MTAVPVMTLRRALVAMLVAFGSMAAACAGTSMDQHEDDDTTTPTRAWTLVWSDEFDGPAGTPPDPSVWTPDIGGDGWGNEQLEYNTDRVENASMDGDGHLVLTAREEFYEGNRYTSARLTTIGAVTANGGRIEARIQLPVGAGIWPAFWMLGENFPEVGWPQCGEIDILEYRGQEPAIVHGTVHGPGYSAGQGITDSIAVAGGGLHRDFHVYAVEWDPGEIRWYVDDLHYHTVTRDDLPGAAPWVFDQPFFLILNIAVGGTFIGPVGPDTSFPQQMRVDYVRIYEDAA